MTKKNLIFLACNYSNKKVKSHFNKIKSKLEKAWPIRVVLIDKERGKGSRDIWKEIQQAIDDSALSIFDVSAFRPNVVLELGYALSIKDPENILITYDERKPRNQKSSPWLLSDIGHLHQSRYKTLEQLDKKINENLSKVPSIQEFKEFSAAANKTNAGKKYIAQGKNVLLNLRDSGMHSDQKIEGLIKGSGLDSRRLMGLLKKHKLAHRHRGSNGRWYLSEE